MATTTPKYGLRKPTASDNVNVALDISGNMDLLDAHAHSGTYVRLSADPTGGSGTPLYWGPALPNDSPLTQLVVKSDTIPSATNLPLSTFELQHDGSQGYILHLTCGTSMAAAAALIGLGGDNAGTCLFVNNKKTGVGIKITQNDTITSALAYGLQINASSATAPGAWFGQGIAGAKAAAVFTANVVAAASQKLVEFRNTVSSASDTLIGYVAADTGNFVWQTQASFQPATNSGIPVLIVGLSGQSVDLTDWNISGGGTVAKVENDGTITSAVRLRSQGAGASFDLYNTSGTTNQRRYGFSDSAGNLLITARNDSNTNLGTIFQITHSSGNITPKDGANIVLGTTTGMKIGTATTQKIGFYNATPIVQPSGTPAAATDLATVITLANDLRTKLLALGLVA